jgi:hypothetical protein
VRERGSELNRLSSEAQIMSMLETLVAGERGLFKPATLTAMQKMTLRFVVVGLDY